MPDTASTSLHGSLRVAIAGVSGYAGGELARLLLSHPRLRHTPPMLLGRMGEDDAQPVALTHLHPQLSGIGQADQLQVLPFTWQQLQHRSIDLILLATPHEQSRAWAPQAIAHGMRVIDLSGAWRLQQEQNRAVYHLEDADPSLADDLQREAVYGSPELHATAIRKARLVANPGCYATSMLLALAPLVRSGLLDLDHGIICDAKSGVSGAGKALVPNNLFMHAADNLSAYAVFGHRHTGEILEQLGLSAEQFHFTPHLLPIPRGILSTLYVRLRQRTQPQAIQAIMDRFYADSPLVRVRPSPQLPQIQHVVRSNFCDLGFHLGPDGRTMVVVSCLDNLLKGAASQAVENMNLMAAWEQAEGLQ